MIPQQKQNVSAGTAQIVNGELIYTISEEQATEKPTINIPDDDYMIKITGAEPKTGKESGEPYIKLEYTIQGDGEPCAGYKLWDNLPLGAKSLWRLHKTMKAAGVQVQPGQQANRININSLVGLYMGVTVKNQDYNGKRQPKVVNVFNLQEKNQQEM